MRSADMIARRMRTLHDTVIFYGHNRGDHMPDPAYSEDERRHCFRCITPIFRMEHELGGTMFDAIILRAAAIGRLEERPMSV